MQFDRPDAQSQAVREFLAEPPFRERLEDLPHPLAEQRNSLGRVQCVSVSLFGRG